MHMGLNKRSSNYIGPALLPFVSFDVRDVLKSVRAMRIAAVSVDSTVTFHHMRALAHVEVGPSVAVIRIHEVLNREDTPREVLEYVIGHELLHTIVHPREEDGKILSRLGNGKTAAT
jgi:hypothetical protein